MSRSRRGKGVKRVLEAEVPQCGARVTGTEKSQKEQIFPKQVNEKIFLLKAGMSPPTAKGTGRGSQVAHTPPGETRGPPRVRQESGALASEYQREIYHLAPPNSKSQQKSKAMVQSIEGHEL